MDQEKRKSNVSSPPNLEELLNEAQQQALSHATNSNSYRLPWYKTSTPKSKNIISTHFTRIPITEVEQKRSPDPKPSQPEAVSIYKAAGRASSNTCHSLTIELTVLRTKT